MCVPYQVLAGRVSDACIPKVRVGVCRMQLILTRLYIKLKSTDKTVLGVGYFPKLHTAVHA